MRKIFKNFDLGFSQFFASFGFLFNNGLGHYFLYPLLIGLGLTVFFAAGIEGIVGMLKTNFLGFLDVSAEEPEGDWTNPGMWWDTVSYWFNSASSVLVASVLKIFFWFLAYKMQKYLVLILMSPIMALLSERVEEILTGQRFKFSWVQFFQDVMRGILITFRNLGFELLIIGLVLAIKFGVWLFIAPLAIVTTPLAAIFLFGLSAYFYGFSAMDYTNERKGRNIQESIAYIKENKGLAIGNGMIYQLLMYIPILGPAVAAICCTAGATLAIHEAEKRKSERFDVGSKRFVVEEDVRRIG